MADAALARIADGVTPALSAALRDLHATVCARSSPRPAAAGSRPAGAVSRRIALWAQAQLAAGDEDLLPHVVELALFGSNLEYRLFAAMCLGATPYQAPVGVALVGEMRAELARRGEHVTIAALWTLTTMGVDVHRPLIRQILAAPSGFSAAVREAAAWALPHCAGRFPVATWNGLLEQYATAWRRRPSVELARVLHGMAYGVGTDGYRHLSESIRVDRTLPAEARRTAAWLLRSRSSLG